MFKRLLLILSIFFMANGKAGEVLYRGSSFQKLDNGVSVVFVDTTKSNSNSNSLLVMLCVSAGSTDELDQEGVANLLTHIFTKRLKANADADSLQYGSEINSYTGYDQSMYYFYGKLENLEGFIKNLGDVFGNFSFSKADMSSSKLEIKQNLKRESKLDKIIMLREARKTLYWHSKYGTNVLGTLEHLMDIPANSVGNFKNAHYTNNRATIIIAGNVKKDEALAAIKKHFGDGKTTSKIDRLQEPPHHGSTTRIEKHSSQVSVPIIEMYWRVPNYRNEKNKALAAEIFIRYLNEALSQSLIEKQQIAASIFFSYSLWNCDYGDFSIAVTSKDSKKVKELITAVLSEIKYIASDGITKEQADKVVKGMISSSNMSNWDALDAVNWIAPKISSGHEFNFIKEYPDFVKKYNLNDVNDQAKEIFKNDPCVISIIKPIEK